VRQRGLLEKSVLHEQLARAIGIRRHQQDQTK